MIKDIEKIRKHLEGYIEVEIPYPFKRGDSVKYITMRKDGESFSTGGEFVCFGNNCIILKNNAKKWSVPTFLYERSGDISYRSRFFTVENSLVECAENNKKLKETIDFQQGIIEKLYTKIGEVEEENKLLKRYLS